MINLFKEKIGDLTSKCPNHGVIGERKKIMDRHLKNERPRDRKRYGGKKKKKKNYKKKKKEIYFVQDHHVVQDHVQDHHVVQDHVQDHVHHQYHHQHHHHHHQYHHVHDHVHVKEINQKEIFIN